MLHYGIWYEGVDWVLRVVEAAYGAAPVVASRKTDPPTYTDRASSVPRFVRYVHNGQQYVNIQGTYSIYQWQLNATGIFGTQPVGGTAAQGHRNWMEMAEGIYSSRLIGVNVAWDDYPAVNISGNSLAGAVAWYLGVLLRAAYPSLVVNVMTFASPRTVDRAYPGPVPTFCVNVQTTRDPVVKLPSSLFSPFVADWRQVGLVQVVKDDGSLAADDFNSTPLLGWGDFTLDFSRHYTNTYLTVLRKRFDSLQAESSLPSAAYCVDTQRLARAAGVWRDFPPLPQTPPFTPLRPDGNPVRKVASIIPTPTLDYPDGLSPSSLASTPKGDRDNELEPLGPGPGPGPLGLEPVPGSKPIAVTVSGGVCNG